MGWNSGYTIFEETVIGAYNLGRLNPALLRVLMEPYRDTDIDSGGSCDLKTNDGMTVEEVVVAIMEPAKWSRLKEQQQLATGDDDLEEEYASGLYDAFHDITSKRFGWG
jgi:hypothetical protein